MFITTVMFSYQMPIYRNSLLDNTSYVEVELHGESKVIQRCFDDNNDDKKKMMTKVMTKSSKINQRTTQVNQISIKEQLK